MFFKEVREKGLSDFRDIYFFGAGLYCMEFRTINGIAHYVFDNEEEFKSHFDCQPVLKYWREADEGDWVWSDDKRIVQILRTGVAFDNYGSYKYKYFRTVVGTFANRKVDFMDTDFSKHKSRYTFGGNGSLSRKRRLSSRDRALAKLIAQGVDPRQAYAQLYRGINEQYVQHRILKFLKDERFMAIVEAERNRIANEVGVGLEWQLKFHRGQCEGSVDSRSKLESAKEISKLTDAYPKETDFRGLDGVHGFISDSEIKELEEGKFKELPEKQEK